MKAPSREAGFAPFAARERSFRPGLRLQITLAIASMLVVGYLPLLFAIGQVVHATAIARTEQTARAAARSIAIRLGPLRDEPRELQRAVDAVWHEGGIVGISAVATNGSTRAQAGEPLDVAGMPASRPEPTLHLGSRPDYGRVVDVALATGDLEIFLEMPAERDAAHAARATRAIGLYLGVFMLGLIVFLYSTLTRLVVRPVEQLARAADRVAGGAQAVTMPLQASRELGALAESVRAMAGRLLADEDVLRGKVIELTRMTNRLASTREQLAGSEHLASVGRLAAGVAHEIGNPIAAILGMHDLLDASSREEKVEFLRRMKKETLRIHEVVRDLLDYARPEGVPSGIGRCSVGDVVGDVLNLLRPQKEWAYIAVDVHVERELHVGLSSQRLAQVLLNVLLNAAAALEHRHDARITIRASTDGTRARIDVEDNGPGIALELRSRIFEPFVSTKESGRGTGLGLSVCQGIVESAGGKIRVDESYEQGARFVIDLPRSA